MRLACRHDVEHLVIKTHSNGTVIGFDALRRLPYELGRKLALFVTAGSPLRKHVELFSWGGEVGTLRAVDGWTNFLRLCRLISSTRCRRPLRRRRRTSPMWW